MLERLLRRDVLLIIATNLLPLFGVLLAGWDAFVLVILYWFETAIIGFWLCFRIAISPPGVIDGFKDSAGKAITNGPAIGAFIALHASVFMAVHLFFLMSIFEGRSGPLEMITGPVLGAGLLFALGGMFVIRGLLTFADHFGGQQTAPAVIGFYVRIIIMQVTILAAVGPAMFFGGTIALVVLIALKTVADIGGGILGELIAARMPAKPR